MVTTLTQVIASVIGINNISNIISEYAISADVVKYFLKQSVELYNKRLPQNNPSNNDHVGHDFVAHIQDETKIDKEFKHKNFDRKKIDIETNHQFWLDFQGQFEFCFGLNPFKYYCTTMCCRYAYDWSYDPNFYNLDKKYNILDLDLDFDLERRVFEEVQCIFENACDMTDVGEYVDLKNLNKLKPLYFKNFILNMLYFSGMTLMDQDVNIMV